ncbi:PDR/VanB family oxidoreductase [Nonomuraea turcica]|uniref:PDR/VanB family oxidoreductase n=1 Tax=Nonomuraea sp. G32 TaxID=3067274 RepID=UPI00273CAC9A|nr:PDR/VanB family oxidoreductase [Nonomuraea sp. G32]MDP4502551.1 PDR/VanB family oxidoreductase [Nonomuraea sp. G32]
MMVPGTQLDLVVSAKEEMADGVVAVTLQHPKGGRLPDWAPGAHVDVLLPNGLTRQYSLCGDRWDPGTYRIGVLHEPESRGGSAYIHRHLQIGDRVAIGGPRNNFRLVPSEHYLFIAGGIGITPLLPMVHQAEVLGVGWRLFYGGRSRATMAFLDELGGYGDRVTVVPEDEQGLLDLPAWLPTEGSATKVYCCGPEGLLKAVERHSAHYPAGQVRTERFVPKEQHAPARRTPFQVELSRSGHTLDVRPGQSVLDVITDAGVHVLTSCRKGVCGTCETGVLAGEPEHRDSLLDDDERAAGDCMFVCVSSSCSDRLVLDL